MLIGKLTGGVPCGGKSDEMLRVGSDGSSLVEEDTPVFGIVAMLNMRMASGDESQTGREAKSPRLPRTLAHVTLDAAIEPESFAQAI